MWSEPMQEEEAVLWFGRVGDFQSEPGTRIFAAEYASQILREPLPVCRRQVANPKAAQAIV